MHRFTDTDDGLAVDITTPVPASWFNAVQEEISYIIEQAGLTLNSSTQDDGGARTQLYAALVSDTLANAILDGAGVTATASEINNVCDTLLFPQRSLVTFTSVDSITISPGVYPLNTQLVYWTSDIVFNLGPTGSGGDNDDSDSLGNDEWHYIYLDSSAIGTDNLISSGAKFRNDTTAPTWSDSKRGWYDGNNDKCIFAVQTNGTAEILNFHHNDNFVHYGDEVNDYDAAPAGLTTEVPLSIPSFCKMAKVTFWAKYIDADAVVRYRTNDDPTGDAHVATHIEVGKVENGINAFDVITDSTQKIEVYISDATDNNTLIVYTNGWYFPIGM